MTLAAADYAEDRRSAEGRRVGGLSALAQARLASALQRLMGGTVLSLLAGAVADAQWPLLWFVGFVMATSVDWLVFKQLLKRCEEGRAPSSQRGLLVWMVFQAGYGSLLAAGLWFSDYSPGPTLAAILLCGAIACAAGTLRASRPFAIAGLAPPALMLLGLPTAEFLLAGADNPHLLAPLVGALLTLGFGISLWRSLLDSDAAQVRAEVAILRERQAAAAAAAAKTDMIKRMNDELRTPMQALAGAAEHLRRAAVTPEARAHIATLAQASEVLKLVLDDLSDLDRLENGQLRIERAPANPCDVVRSVASAFRTAAQDKQLELLLDLGETPALVEMDVRRVRQILFNLVANAVRYTTHGGVRISLAARSAETAGRVKLQFNVADTGAGMTRAQLARVFGRDRLCAGGEGPGLGLAISLRLARLMGGTLHAKSESGEGSVFTLVLEARVVAAGRTAA